MTSRSFAAVTASVYIQTYSYAHWCNSIEICIIVLVSKVYVCRIYYIKLIPTSDNEDWSAIEFDNDFDDDKNNNSIENVRDSKKVDNYGK